MISGERRPSVGETLYRGGFIVCEGNCGGVYDPTESNSPTIYEDMKMKTQTQLFYRKRPGSGSGCGHGGNVRKILQF